MGKRAIEVIARGVCIKGGRILLCHSKGAPNTYLPGGHVEFRERAAESLRREIAEEMGLDARVGEFLGASEHSFERKGKSYAEVNLLFAFDAETLTPERAPPSCEDYIEFVWVDLEDLPGSNMEPGVLRERVADWSRDRAETADRMVTSGDAWGD